MKYVKNILSSTLLSLLSAQAQEPGPLDGFVRNVYKEATVVSSSGSVSSPLGVGLALEGLRAIVSPSEDNIHKELAGLTVGGIGDDHPVTSLIQALKIKSGLSLYAFLPETGSKTEGIHVLTTMGHTVHLLDFNDAQTACEHINGIVSHDTSGRIPSILETNAVSPLTKFILLHTLHVEQKWQYFFNPRQLTFYIGNNQHTVRGFTGIVKLPSYENEGTIIFQIPTKEGASLFIKLSAEGVSPITYDDMQTFEKNKQAVMTLIHVPFVTQNNQIDLKESLRGVMPLTFGNDGFATKLSDQPLIVTMFKQNVNIRWDHVGFVGSSASALVGCLKGVPNTPKKTINVNRPFSYMFADNRVGGSEPVPLFSGTVTSLDHLSLEDK